MVYELPRWFKSITLLEMLENAIRRYQNKIIDTAQVIQELIDLANQVRESDKRGEQHSMSRDEIAFYDAVAQNQSARDVLGDDALRELSRSLVEQVRKSASIDWTVREDVRAKMRVIVKRLLRHYGYPPDQEKMALDRVLKQAEVLAEEWVG